MSFVIRTPTAADREPLQALIQAVWATDTLHRLGQRYELLRIPRLVAVVGTDVIGTLGWAPLPPEFTDAAKGEWILDLTDSEPPVMKGVLIDVTIVGSHRRQGAGQALLEAGLRQMRQTGLSEVLTSLPADNAPGLSFLRQVGFTPTNGPQSVGGSVPAEMTLAKSL